MSITLCLFLLMLYVSVNNFSVTSGRCPVFLAWTSAKQRIKCQGHNTVLLVSLELVTLRSQASLPMVHFKMLTAIYRVPFTGKRLKAGHQRPPGRGGLLWYFHTYVGSGHFLGFKILNFNIFLAFSEKLIFFGVWRFCGYFLGVITKLDYI